ncbi:MAG: hypothetical protein NC332_00565 [Firmicutes bacterium]|nr:hypothetical protein [Bacillota bacterium]
MPKRFKKEFRVEGCTARIRERCDGRYKRSYEIRYRRNGYNVTASATTLDEAKKRFIEKLHIADKQTASKTGNTAIPTKFDDFAYFWFEHFHKRKVSEDTYKDNKGTFKRTLSERFVGKSIKQINSIDLQEVLDEINNSGFRRKAESVYGLLNQIFTTAEKLKVIDFNPVSMLILTRHEREHGKALSFDEEKTLLSATAGTHFQLMFAVALYTGMRPNEFKTAEIQNEFIIARNSKRKNGKVEYKRIPILEMLKPYLKGVDKIKWVKYDKIREKFNEILPNHKLYDLRTTFYTRCEMFGVAESARNEMVGHSGGKLKDTYTDLPDEFLLSEAKKLVW